MSFLPIAVIAYIIYTVVKKAKATGGFETLMKEIQEAQNKDKRTIHEGETYDHEYEQEYEEGTYSDNSSYQPYTANETFQKKDNLLKEGTSSSTTYTNKSQQRIQPQVNAEIDDESVYSSEKSAYHIDSKEDLKRAFVWSEILNRKYN